MATTTTTGYEYFDAFLARKAREYGNKWDPSELTSAPQFIPYLHADQRIKVETTYPSGATDVRTGTIGVTTGWRPAFLLMRRSSSYGSSDVLSGRDRIIGVQERGKRTYQAVAND